MSSGPSKDRSIDPKAPPHAARFMKKDEHEGGKKFSPFAAKNKSVIAEKILPLLPAHAQVLEIASGSGEHGLHICRQRPDIMWQCSDVSSDARKSQNAWAKDSHGQMPPALRLDCSEPRWFEKAGTPDVIFCANMIHIAPWAAAEGLAAGAGALLRAGGRCILYGPFLEGEQTAQSNFDFDANLKARNPDWGVRDLEAVKHIFALAGFNAPQKAEMPNNNRFLVFSRLS